MKRVAPLCSLLLLLAAAPALAAPRKGHTIYQSKQLWSTVDICNTKKHPLTIGVRGSMPGSGIKQERMFMRFQVQYRTAAGLWTYIGPPGDSGFVGVGVGNFKVRQAGRNFLLAPKKGTSYALRGVVTFQWRRGSKIVRRAQKATKAGHRSAAGADPPGYSREICQLA